VIYVCEHHDEVYALWRRKNLRGIHLSHIDFHDDLRGLLIDRKRGRAYPIGKFARQVCPIDDGNFLAHAVIEGRLDRVSWVHFAKGGRAWDFGIVRYESDLLAIPARLRQFFLPGKEYPLQFEEVVMENWQGLAPGDALSIDWDCFASINLDHGGIDNRLQEFLDRMGSQIPPDTYVAYSPDYSHPSLESFNGMLDTLSSRFKQQVEWLKPNLKRGELNLTGQDASLPHEGVRKIILALRRLGIY
jgi:hypothetical protein